MFRWTGPILILIVASSLVGLLTGCRGESKEDVTAADDATPITPVEPPTMRLVREPESLRTLLVASFDSRDERLFRAIARSHAWFDSPESQAEYPTVNPRITHEKVAASLSAIRLLLRTAVDAESFADEVIRRFDIYESVGLDGWGKVQFTAYYAPEYDASRTRTAEFRHPLYGPPDDLRPDNTESLIWRTRREIEERDLLASREIAWLANPLDVYLVHVNGSARLRLPDGEAMHVGYSATNERPYTSLGRLMIDEGLATEDEMSMAKIREVYEREPARVESLMLENDRYVFFQEVEGEGWPRAALGMPLTSERSIATDKSAFPPGALALVETTLPAVDREPRTFAQFVLDQDRGGAIKGPGRADLYLGVGEEIGEIAGRMNANGRLFYLLLK